MPQGIVNSGAAQEPFTCQNIGSLGQVRSSNDLFQLIAKLLKGSRPRLSENMFLFCAGKNNPHFRHWHVDMDKEDTFEISQYYWTSNGETEDSSIESRPRELFSPAALATGDILIYLFRTATTKRCHFGFSFHFSIDLSKWFAKMSQLRGFVLGLSGPGIF